MVTGGGSIPAETGLGVHGGCDFPAVGSELAEILV